VILYELQLVLVLGHLQGLEVVVPRETGHHAPFRQHPPLLLLFYVVPLLVFETLLVIDPRLLYLRRLLNILVLDAAPILVWGQRLPRNPISPDLHAVAIANLHHTLV